MLLAYATFNLGFIFKVACSYIGEMPSESRQEPTIYFRLMFSNVFWPLEAPVVYVEWFKHPPKCKSRPLVLLFPGNPPWREPSKEGCQSLYIDGFTFTFAFLLTVDCI